MYVEASGGEQVNSPKAHVIVVPAIGAPQLAPSPMLWSLVLRGGLLVDIKYMRWSFGSPGVGAPRGTCVAFASAMTTHRQFWCSSSFQHRHADLRRVLLQSRWTEIKGLRECAKHFNGKNQGLSKVAFVAETEKELGRWLKVNI